jgi:transposase
LSVVDERSRVANRIQKILEDANLKLSAVATDIKGVSAQAILKALLGGEDDPVVRANRARARMRAKRAELERALAGRVRDHHRFLLRQLLEHREFLDTQIRTLEEQIEVQLASMPRFADLLPKLDPIPGVDRMAAITILAEIGVDMSRFPSSKHLAAWAGMTPGNNETGGKARPARTRQGNRYLRRILAQVAHAAARKKEGYLRAMYYRLARRRGEGRAAVAVGHAILEIVYYLIRRDETYQDLGADYLERRNSAARVRYLKRELERLDFTVTLEPKVA